MSILEWYKFEDIKPKIGEACLVKTKDNVTQYMALIYDGDEFVWADGYEYGESYVPDPFPTEEAAYWMYLPK